MIEETLTQLRKKWAYKPPTLDDIKKSVCKEHPDCSDIRCMEIASGLEINSDEFDKGLKNELRA